MKSKENMMGGVYKVTGTVYVRARNVRHAAHIGKGLFAMSGPEGASLFTVAKRNETWDDAYLVDVNVPGDAKPVTADDKIGGTDSAF